LWDSDDWYGFVFIPIYLGMIALVAVFLNQDLGLAARIDFVISIVALIASEVYFGILRHPSKGYYVGQTRVKEGTILKLENGATKVFNSDRMVIDGAHILDYVRRGYVAWGTVVSPIAVKGHQLYEKS